MAAIPRHFERLRKGKQPIDHLVRHLFVNQILGEECKGNASRYWKRVNNVQNVLERNYGFRLILDACVPDERDVRAVVEFINDHPIRRDYECSEDGEVFEWDSPPKKRSRRNPKLSSQ